MGKLNIDISRKVTESNGKCASGEELRDAKAFQPVAQSEGASAITSTQQINGDTEGLVESGTQLAAVKVIKLKWYRKCLFALGGAPYQMLTNVIGFFVSMYLLNVAQIPPFLCSVILLGGRICDALTDPLVGVLVERSPPRYFGRLKTWMFFSMPLTCATYWLFWYVPPFFYKPIAEASNSEVFIRFAYYFVLMLVLQILFTCHQVPFSSLTMYISNSKMVRDSATAFRMAFEMMGVLTGVLVSSTLIKNNNDADACANRCVNASSNNFNHTSIYSNYSNESSTLSTVGMATPNSSKFDDSEALIDKQQRTRNSYMMTASVLVTIHICCVLCVMFGVKEHQSIKQKKVKHEPFLMSLKRALSFRPYLILMLAFLQIAFVMQNVQANLVLFVTYSLGLTRGTLSIGMATLLGTGVLCVPIWQFVQRRFGKQWAFAGGLISILPALCAMLFIPFEVLGLKPVFFTLCSLSGASVSVAYLCPWSMLPDVIDAYFLKERVRPTSVFYSFYVFFSKLAVGVAIGVSQAILGLVGFKNGVCPCEQPPVVADALRYLISVPSLVAAFGSLLCVYLYPITESVRKDHENQLRFIRQFEGDEEGVNSNSTDSTPTGSISPPSSSSSSSSETESASLKNHDQLIVDEYDQHEPQNGSTIESATYTSSIKSNQIASNSRPESTPASANSLRI